MVIYVYGVSKGQFIWRYDGDSQKLTQIHGYQRLTGLYIAYVLDNYIYIGLGNASNSLISYDPTWDN